MRKKIECFFYKSSFTKFSAIDLFPVFEFSKSVQGNKTMRVFSLNWFTYAISVFVREKTSVNETAL